MSDTTAGRESDSELLRSIDRSLRSLVRLQIKVMQGGKANNEMILLLHAMGWRPVEIADALGKTQNDVNPVISRARAKRKQSNDDPQAE